MTKKILVLQKDPNIANIIIEFAEKSGYSCDTAHDGEVGLEKAGSGEYDLILLDTTLPIINGFDICRLLREESVSTPIIMVTEQGDLSDRVRGLENGANDYVIKPFSMHELFSRIKALLRRPMFIEERHQAILSIIEEKQRISIGEIQEKFDVSVDSARRDLRILEEKGLIKRTHGGAIPVRQIRGIIPRHRDMKNMEVWDNYAAIAKKSAEFIKENDIVYITSGTIGFIMLKYLPRDINYTLVVNSVTLADELKYWDNIIVYIVGGKMRMHGTTSLVDSFATAFAKNMHYDICFMTGGGYDSVFGFSNETDETATFQRTIIENSRKKILMMPNTKIGFKSFLKVCDTDKFDTLITDWDAVEDELAKIEQLGVEVIVVEKE